MAKRIKIGDVVMGKWVKKNEMRMGFLVKKNRDTVKIKNGRRFYILEKKGLKLMTRFPLI